MDDGTRQTLAKEKSFHTFHLQETEDQQPCEQPYGFHMEHPGNVFYAAVEQSWVHQGSQFPPLPNNRQRTFTSYIVEALLRVDIQCRVIVTCVKFTFANEVEAVHERSLENCQSWTALNFSLKLSPFCLSSILFTWLKSTCVNVRSHKRVSGNQP